MSEKKSAPRQPAPEMERLSSGVPGLDTLLSGGFLRGNVYLLLGPPGSGKTILANQICFHHAKEGRGNVVYVTLLAESHSRMMGNLRSLDYYQDEMVARSIHYMSGYRALEKDGLKGLLIQIASIVRDQKATMLLIDGVATIGDLNQSDLDFRKFTHELNSYIGTSGCTAFLLSSMEGHHSDPEHTMVDGIVALHQQVIGLRASRKVEVRKFRGSDHLKGKHLFTITEHGVRIYPRAESLPMVTPLLGRTNRKLPFGVKGLDQMLHGGVLEKSVTTLIGPAGVGKTILALQFLRAGVDAGERALFFGFYETPEELIDKGESMGVSLSAAVTSGKLDFLWFPPLELELDQLGSALLEAIERTGAKRVVIDGVDGFRLSTNNPRRINRYLVSLALRVRAMGATLLIVEEMRTFSGPRGQRAAELSAINENVFCLRHRQYGANLFRTISVIKVRKDRYDPSVKEFVISSEGLRVQRAPWEAEPGSRVKDPIPATNAPKPPARRRK